MLKLFEHKEGETPRELLNRDFIKQLSRVIFYSSNNSTLASIMYIIEFHILES